MNYLQMQILTYDRQATFLAEAEQRRLADTVAPAQIHPVRVWVGQRLVTLGRQLQSAKEIPVLPIISQTVAR